MEKIKWGIAGTGYIARRFAQAMDFTKQTEKTAVCSRSLEQANEFASEYRFQAHYDSFGAMLAQSSLDVAYIATPNHVHFDYVVQALEAGVHVLCEKPMADNMQQLETMIAKAKEKGLFLMEGMWSRCFPATQKVRKWIAEGKIGQIRSVHAGFGLHPIKAEWQQWKTSREMSAGALRDLGVYTLSMAHMAMGELPLEIASSYQLKNGTDIHEELLLKYNGGKTAFLVSSYNMITDYRAYFIGDQGMISLGDLFYCPNKAELFLDQEYDMQKRDCVEYFCEEYPSTGFQYEIDHVNEALLSDKKESSLYSLQDSKTICSIIDGLRKEWGIVYDSDSSI